MLETSENAYLQIDFDHVLYHAIFTLKITQHIRPHISSYIVNDRFFYLENYFICGLLFISAILIPSIDFSTLESMGILLLF